MARHHTSPHKKMEDGSDEHTQPKRGGSYYVDGKYFHGSSEFANMPEGVTMKKYPPAAHGDHGGLDDTMTGIDESQHEMTRETARHLSNLKV
jgi:hypothetical protein